MLQVYEAELQAAAAKVLGSTVPQVMDSARRAGLGRGYPLITTTDTSRLPGVYSVPRFFRNPASMYAQCEYTGCIPGEPVPGWPGWYIVQESILKPNGVWHDGAGIALQGSILTGRRITMEVKDNYDGFVQWDKDANGGLVNPRFKDFFVRSKQGLPATINEVRNQVEEAELVGAQPVVVFTHPVSGRILQSYLERDPYIAGKVMYYYKGEIGIPTLTAPSPTGPIFPRSLGPNGQSSPLGPGENVILPVPVPESDM